jgi:hypothetical protein
MASYLKAGFCCNTYACKKRRNAGNGVFCLVRRETQLSLKTDRKHIGSGKFAVESRYQRNGEKTANWEELKLSW